MTPPRRSQARPLAVNARMAERIHCLWDELTTYEAARSEEALMHLLGTVAGLVNAQNAYWMGAVRVTDDERDPLRGWRPGIVRYLQPLPNDERFTKQRIRSIQKGGGVDELTMAQARLAGTFRACRMQDLVSADWFKGETYQGYLGRRVFDSLTVGVPVSTTAEAYYGFFRMREGERFSEAQRAVAHYAMRGLTWFHRQVLLAHGFAGAKSPLSPMERRVLALLLTDRTEKMLAQDLGVTLATVHTYIRSVIRKLGVKGRHGLVSLWLGRPA